MKLTLLGTGFPAVNPRRRGPSQVIESGDELILVDCGAGAAHRLVEAGYQRPAIRRIAFTHLHSDHTTGLPDLLWGGWVGRWWDEPPLIVGPPGTARFVEYLLEAFSYDIHVRTTTPGGEGLKVEWLRPRVEEVEEGWTAEGRDWRLTAFRVEHEPVDQAFGFRLDEDGRSLVISGDTSPSENLVRHAQDVHLLVHEVMKRGFGPPPNADAFMLARMAAVSAYHTKSDEVGQIATAAGARHLALSHILFRNATPEELAADVAPSYKGPITVGDDLMSFQVGPNGVERV